MPQREQDLVNELRVLTRRIRLSFAISTILLIIFLTDIFWAARLLEQSQVQNAEGKLEINEGEESQNDSFAHELTWANRLVKDSELQEERRVSLPSLAHGEHGVPMSHTNITQTPVESNIKYKPLPPPPPPSNKNRVTLDTVMAIMKTIPFNPPPLSDGTSLNPRVFRKAQQCLLNASYVPRGKLPLLRDPNYTLPKDIEAHYIDMLRLTEPLRNIPISSYAGYHGPWLENVFISEFCCDKPLSYFGGLVPLFVQWTDLWWTVHREAWYNHTVGRTFLSNLRKDVIYLVVSQHADGIFHRRRFVHPRNHWNLLVFSGGGKGHAPIPLFLNEQPYEDFDPNLAQYLFVFAGTIQSRVREVMVSTLDELSVSDPPVSVRLYSGSLWQKVMRSGLLCLAPRGYGRTSFRIVEAIQMGLIPVYLYDDHDWSPYKGTPAHVSNFGYVVHISNFKAFAQQMAIEQNKDPAGFLAMLEEKRVRMRQFRDSHYTLAGLVEQISYFVQDDARSSITCQRNPHRA